MLLPYIDRVLRASFSTREKVKYNFLGPFSSRSLEPALLIHSCQSISSKESFHCLHPTKTLKYFCLVSVSVHSFVLGIFKVLDTFVKCPHEANASGGGGGGGGMYESDATLSWCACPYDKLRATTIAFLSFQGSPHHEPDVCSNCYSQSGLA